MTLIVEIAVTLLVLSVLILGHELGHFVAGRLLGFEILEFAMGMGPRVAGFSKNGIDYNIRAFPIGGMCRFAEEDDKPRSPNSFRAKKPWQRAIVVFAGPFMNFAVALLLSLALFWGWGIYDNSRIVVESVSPNGAAQTAGILPGDEILIVDGKAIHSFDTLRSALDTASPDSFEVIVLRGEKEKRFSIANAFDKDSNAVMLGVTITYPRVRNGFFDGFKNSFSYCKEMGSLVFDSLGMLFTGKAGINDMSGVIGVTRIVGEAVSLGWASVISLSVMLSMNLGIMNLLPVPALDGGRLLFIIIELIRGKPVKAEKEGTVHFIGMVLLLGLMVYLMFHDVIAWVGG